MAKSIFFSLSIVKISRFPVLWQTIFFSFVKFVLKLKIACLTIIMIMIKKIRLISWLPQKYNSEGISSLILVLLTKYLGKRSPLILYFDYCLICCFDHILTNADQVFRSWSLLHEGFACYSLKHNRIQNQFIARHFSRYAPCKTCTQIFKQYQTIACSFCENHECRPCSKLDPAVFGVLIQMKTCLGSVKIVS